MDSQTIEPFALLNYENKVYFSAREIRAGVPHSPVVDLIQGIYDTHPNVARSMLRHRIYLSYPPTDMCRQMIKVAAKRFEVLAGPPILIADWIPVAPYVSKNIPWPMGDLVEAGDFPDFCLRLAKFSGSPVASILVSAENKIIGWAVNSNETNKTLHAEVNLVQASYLKRGHFLPAGSRIYTSLKPCRMCAAMIHHCSPAENPIPVFYVENDPGPWARGTVLDHTPWLHQIS